MVKHIVAFVILAAPASGFQIPFPQDTVAYNDRFNNRQSAVFDSRGALHVAYSGQIGTNSTTREIYYVTDSAGTLVTKQATNNLVDDNYPTIVIDRNDTPHVCFLGRDAGNLFQVQYTRLQNGAFTTPVFITQAGLNKATPWAAMGRDSVMHFLYFTFATGTNHAYYRSYDLRNSMLSPEMQLTPAEVTGDFDGSVAVDTAGYIHIVVKSGSAFGGALKYFTNRTGTLVETPTGVSVNVNYPRVLVDHNNVVHILYRNSSTERLHLLNNAGGSFGAPVAISPAGQRPAGFHAFAVDAASRIYVVYQSSVTASGRGWFLVHGKDAAFTDTIKVSDLPPGYVTRNTSTAVARGNGEVAILYSPGASRGGSVVCDIFMQRGTIQTTSVHVEEPLPLLPGLDQNFPNPFNPATTIRFRIASPDLVTLRVFDMLGREVATLVNERLEPGSYARVFHAEGLASGVYVLRLRTGGATLARKMILAR